DAAASFASLLRAQRIRVLGQVSATTAPRGAAPITSVHSPYLPAIVGWMLRESNNVIAENLARQVALRTGRPASFAGAAAAAPAPPGRGAPPPTPTAPPPPRPARGAGRPRESTTATAETRAGRAARRPGRPASFAGAAAAVTAAAARLGIRRGIHMVDGSGL